MIFSQAFAIVIAVLSNKAGHNTRFDSPEDIIMAGKCLKEAWRFQGTIAETFFKVMATFYVGNMILPNDFLYSDEVHHLERILKDGEKGFNEELEKNGIDSTRFLFSLEKIRQ